MDKHVPDACVMGHAELVPMLTLPDPGDRHVLAAAIVGGATTIVTFNLKDFPDHLTAPHDCRAVHPDQFLLEFAVGAPERLMAAVRAILARLLNPPLSFDDYINVLHRVRLPRTAGALAAMTDDISS